jgi:hypothetical protein
MADERNIGSRSSWMDEDDYWRRNFSTRPYGRENSYEVYQPGYRYGYEAAGRYDDRDWDDIESDLERDWDAYPDRGTSTWQQVKNAARDAWDRVRGRR